MADLRSLLGDAFKEGMTIDEINAALASRDFMDRSELAGNYVAKSLFDTTASQLAAEKKKNKTAQDGAAQKETEWQQRVAALEESNKAFQRKSDIADTKASLLALGYDDALAGETAEAMVDGNMAKVLENQGKYKAALQQSLKDEGLKNTKNPASGGNGGTAVDFAKAKEEALNDGNDALYFALCSKEMEQAAANK